MITIPEESKVHLRNVTLMAVDGGDLKKIQDAVQICTTFCKFDAIRLLHPEVDTAGYQIRIEPMDYEQYNRFLVKEMYKYCNTSHMLVIQPDGFILNPNAWTDDFLQYDWMGAIWYHYGDNNRVGNGGFSLRSRNFMEIASKAIHLPNYAPEDHNLIRIHGDVFRKCNMKFATETHAEQFSVESKPWVGSFGFHGRGTNISDWLVSTRWKHLATAHNMFRESPIKDSIVWMPGN